jgi:hypothetical protein
MSEQITVKEIITKYLKENGYDGLASEDCGCGIDDLMAWGDIPSCKECNPAYKRTCDKCEMQEDCQWVNDVIPLSKQYCYTIEKPEVS